MGETRDRIKEALKDLWPVPQEQSLEDAAESLEKAWREADRSHDTIRTLLSKAVSPTSQGSGAFAPSAWVRDVYDDWFAYTDESSDKTFKRSYVIDDKDVVTLGDAQEVVLTMTYEPVGEAQESQESELTSDIMALVEQAVTPDNTVSLKFIRPGWGSSGYYPADVLARDGAKAFPSGTKMYWDHPTSKEAAERPEGSLRNLAGKFVTDAAWRPSGTAGPGLYADAQVFAGYAELVNEMAPDIGVSIRARGKAKKGEAEGKKGPIITELTDSQSVDYITLPGAGGKVLQLFESARTMIQEDIVDEKQAKERQEANDALVAENAELKAANAESKAALLGSEIKAFVSEALAEAKVPEPTRQKLTESLIASPVIVDGKLDEGAYKTAIDEAVKAELAYLASVTEGDTKQIRGMGPSTPLVADGSKVLFEAEKRAWIQMGKTDAEAENLAKLAARGR